MKRFAGIILVLVLVLAAPAALALRAECPVGGFSVNLPDHFWAEELDPGDPDLCFNWRGNKLTVHAYASYQGEVALSDLFLVMTGAETESGYTYINGMEMFWTRTEEYGMVTVTYTWMDRGNSVTLEFSWEASETSVQKTVDSIINSVRFDSGH